MSTELAITDNEPSQAGGQLIEVATSRQAQEVQAMCILAKKYPRDMKDAMNRILASCRRKGLAELATYKYPKGGKEVTGPSIRLAECLAQCWGNIDYGLIELSQTSLESSVMAYCWDAETNTRSSKVFTVPQVRSTKQGTYPLTDPRERYENMANQGARRVRAAILAVIPKDVQDMAVETCMETLNPGEKELPVEIKRMVTAFAQFNVTPEMIEKRLGRNMASIDGRDLVSLRGVYTSLKDGMSTLEDWFEVTPVAPASAEAAAEPGESKTTRKAKELKSRKKAAGPAAESEANSTKADAAAEPAQETVEPPAAAPAPASSADVRAAARGLPFYDEYADALLACKDDVACRNVCSAMILPQKDQLPPEVYGEFLRMRDLMIAKLQRESK